MTRVGTKGQVVIPQALRDRLGLHPGVEVSFDEDGEAVRVAPTGGGDGSLRGRYPRSGMASRLLADRRAEPR